MERKAGTMTSFDVWLATRGPYLSKAMELHREQICDIVSARLATVFPSLCYDPARPDAERFQQITYHEVPRRFQRVLQAVILFQSLTIIDQEYRWGWSILPNYGVTRQHMLTHVRWYFDALRLSIPLDGSDLPHLSTFERDILQIIDEITATEPPPRQQLVVQNRRDPFRLNGRTH